MEEFGLASFLRHVQNVLLFILMVFFCFRVCVIVVGQISTCANNFSRERERERDSMYL